MEPELLPFRLKCQFDQLWRPGNRKQSATLPYMASTSISFVLAAPQFERVMACHLGPFRDRLP